MNRSNRNIQFHILILSFVIGLLCSCNPSKKITTPSYEVNVDAYLSEFCANESEEEMAVLKTLNFSGYNQFKEFYKNRNYKSVWVDAKGTTASFDKALRFLRSSMNYGLDTTPYLSQIIAQSSRKLSAREFSFTRNINRVGVEILTTHSLILLMNHLSVGIIKPDSSIYGRPIRLVADSVPYYLEKSIRAGDYTIAVNALSPKSPHYRDFQTAFEEYMKIAQITTEKYPVPYFAKDSNGCKAGVEKMLKVHGYLKKEQGQSIRPNKVIASLVKFQTDFGLNNRGRYDTLTIETLRNSSFDLYRKACMTFQRLRWSEIKDPNYILVNIPSFSLHLVEEGEIAIYHRIVCGKPDHETPELNSRISHFNLFPEWNVPHKISTKELLPLIQADPKYLEKFNYEVINGKNEVVDASKIKWKKFTEKNFPYRIRQSSGEGNSLGIIKFYFANRYGVYLHDTPSKKLFEKNYRAFSHGCMRIQNPFDFAKILLEFKKGMLHFPEKKLKEMKKFEKQKKFDKYRKNEAKLPEVEQMDQDVISMTKTTFTMNRPLPIYVRYLTAFINEKNKLQFYPDLYHKDAPYFVRFEQAVKSTTLIK